MAARLPPLNPLRAFEATARRGSVSAAARELNVTHGAISHQIRALELSVNTPLFERGSKRLKLTPQGALLLPAVTRAFDEIAAATAAMTRPATSGTLSITCVPALLSFWLIPRLHLFTEQYPDVRLTLTASNDPANVFNPLVDLSLLYGDGTWGDVWTRLWSRLSLFPSSARRSSPAARCARSRISAITRCCMAMMDASGTPGWLRPTPPTWCAAASIS